MCRKSATLLIFMSLWLGSCKNEVVYPPFDSTAKLLEIDHEYNYIADVYTFNYDADGKLIEMYGRGLLLSKFYYDGGYLTKIETSFEDGDPEETYLFDYASGKVFTVLFTHTQVNDSIQYKYRYEYTTDAEFIRYDSIYYPTRELVQISDFTLNQVVHNVYVSGKLNNSYTEKISYSKFPNFLSSFHLPLMPDPVVYRAFGITASSEILEEASYLPKEVNQGLEYYDYDYQDGLIRKIFIESPNTGQSEIVTLVWND